MKLRPLLATAFLLFSLNCFSQKISFFREDLDFKLSNEVFEVDGLYYFRNNTNQEIRQMLFYPFPDVEKYGEIKYISITIENDTTSMLATQSAHGALFKVLIKSNEEVAYRIKYGQKVKGNAAKYIITTTQKWEKPFELADYSLKFPAQIVIDSISIAPDSVEKTPDFCKYYWLRYNFMPVCDFDIFFRK